MLRVRRSARGDEGVAIVVALLVTLIVFVLVTGVLAQSIHNISQAGYGRKRLSAVNAAEAGLNWYANEAARSQLALLSTPFWSYDAATGWYGHAGEAVASVPQDVSFEMRVIYSTWSPCQTLAADGVTKVAITCTINPAQNPRFLANKVQLVEPFPATVYAVVRSIGIVGDPDSDTSVRRALEAYVRLRAVRNAVSGGLNATSACLENGTTLTIVGDFAVNNQAESWPTAFPSECKTGDIVVPSGGGLILVPSGDQGGNLQVRGGGLTVIGNATLNVPGDVWTEGPIRLGDGTAVSGLSACPAVITAFQCVGDDAIGSAVLFGPNAAVLGDTIACDPSCAPPPVFPEITWDPSYWTADGWTITTISTNVSTLFTQIEAATVPTVFHVTPTDPNACDVSLTAATLSLKTKVAVVSQCRYKFERTGATIQNATGYSGGTLLLISAWPVRTNCNPVDDPNSSKDTSVQDVVVTNNQNFTAPVFLYTPCVMWIENNNAGGGEMPVVGQFVARYMKLKNAVRLSQNPILTVGGGIPGGVTGFKQDVKFVRELQWCKADQNLSTDVACS